MKILQVVPYFHPACAFGGPVEVAFQMSRELAKNGHDVTVYTTDAKDFSSKFSVECLDAVDSVKVYYFHNASMRLVNWSKLFVTPQILSKAKDEVKTFDVVHLHEYRTFQNVVIHHYAKQYGVPYVLQAHGSLPRTMMKQRLKWIFDVLFGYRLLRDASRVIALSPIEARQCNEMGIPEERIAVIANGVDIPRHLPPRGKFRERYNIEEGRKIILFLGRINRLKGIDFLIEAFSHMTRNMKNDALLVFVGPDNGYLRRTKELVKQRGIEELTLFTGPLLGSRKVEAYVDASLVASLDSLEEVVFLLVPLEAAACGTPVIVTESNYIAKLVEEGKFGSWVEYGNVLKLAAVLEEMLSDEGLMREMGSNGRAYVSRNFNWNENVSLIEEVYRNSIG